MDLQREITGSDTAHEEAGIHANAQSIAVVCENFLKVLVAILTDLTVIP